jgi:2-keto-3-deoxy-L-rhamnonate aldolase RhmA
MAALTPARGAHQDQMLVRRLMVACPNTGIAVDTGAAVTVIPNVQQEQEAQILVDCIECGQDHEWRLDDAFMEPT